MAANAPVRVIVSADDGMMVGGDFTTWGGTASSYLVEVDWSTTTAIKIAGAFNGPVTAMIGNSGSPDYGSLICFGSFTQCLGQPRLGFAHLDRGPFGSSSQLLLRPTQHSLTGGVARCAVRLPMAAPRYEGSTIHIGGEFTTFNDYSANGLASVDETVTFPYDETFLAARSASTQVILPAPKVLAIAKGATSDRLYIGGEFTSVGGRARTHLARLYGPSLNTLPSAVTTLKVSPLDDTRTALHWSSTTGATSYLVQRSPAGAGTWTTLAETSVRWFLDSGLTSATAYSYRIVAKNLAGQTTGSQIVNASSDSTPWTGSGNAPAGQSLPIIARNDVVDCDFHPDGRAVIAGTFTATAGQLHDSISILLPDGTLDPSFQPPGNLDGSYHAVKVQPDGKILVAGSFSTLGGLPRVGLARLNPDGSVDPGFTPTLLRGSSVYFTVYDVDLLPDGRVAVIGGFDNVDGHSQEGIAVLLPDGRRDPSFDPVGGITASSGYELRVLPDQWPQQPSHRSINDRAQTNRIAHIWDYFPKYERCQVL